MSSSTSSESSNSFDEESLSEEELAVLMEQVEQRKKLISAMRNKPWRMVKKLSVLRYQEPPPLESSPAVSCILPFLETTFFAAGTITPQPQKKWPAEPGQSIWAQRIRVKMWNLIFSLCNQRTDKVQICSTDIHHQVILHLYLKPSDSLLSVYLLKQSLCPALLIHAHC